MWAALCLAAALMPARGATVAPDAAACAPDDGEGAVVKAVNPDLSLALADGRQVRLVGVEPVGEAGERPDGPNDARTKLAAWLDGRDARLRLFGEAPDRWNRWPALAFASAPGDTAAPPLSVALAMVDAGLARARPEAEAHACWAALRAAEDGARVARLGLWADPYYAVRRADDVGLADLVGAFVVVEGRVAHQNEVRDRVFLDLGPRHRALAARMSKRMLFSLDQGGPGQNGPGRDTWVGRRIRLRGVVDDRGGPVIDVLDADQVEVLRDGGGNGAQP